MIIHVFSIMHNEEFFLPYFLRHYETFADKIFIFNDHSTDNTVEIAKTHPKVKVLDFPYQRGLEESDFSNCFQDAYKKYSRGIADWVICADCDEIVYNPNIMEYLQLQTKKGRKVLRARGYDMVSSKLPATKGQIYEECYMGYPNTIYSKMIIINPELDVVFSQGRHKIVPIDGINTDKGKLKLLHYKYLSKDYFMEHYVKTLPRRGLSSRIMAHKVKRGLDRFKNDFMKTLERVV